MSDDPLVARLVAVVDAHLQGEDTARAVSLRAGQRPGWLADHMQAWRGGRARRGREPTWSTIQSLARGLGCSVSELLGPDILDRCPPPPRP